MHDSNVLISGAGIAGPAIAYWLRKAGFVPTVVERAPAPRPGGQAVDLRGAGRTIMQRMGLLERSRELALEQRGFAYVDDRGHITARMPASAFGGEGIVSEIEILRGDLARVLFDATDGETEYLFDDTITAIDQDADGVTVAFEKATARRFALVVGADGLHSTVRRLVFSPDAALRPLNLYHAWFTAQADIDLDNWFLMYNAPGGLVASARPGHAVNEIKASLSFRSTPRGYERWDRKAQRNLVAQRLARAGWAVPRLIDAMWQADDFYFDMVAQVHLSHWSRGRVVLLGDAGYCASPLTGLGTSLSLVGAYILAGELGQARGDYQVAFERYQAHMRPYVDQAQQLPPGGVNGYAPNGALGISLRAASMRWMLRWPMRQMFAAQFAKAEAIDVPDYAFSATCSTPLAA